MAKAIRTKRAYDSSHRRALAAQTRRRILESARKLFMERGYAGAAMPAIAAEAGVGLQTIYASFQNKPRLLVALFNASSAAQGEENVPMPQRAGPRAAAGERDQRRQIEMLARVVADNLAGAAPVSEILVDAARTEPEIQRVLKRLNAQRLAHMALAAEQIRANGPFRSNMDTASARDIIWALTSPELFLLLTRDRGWSKEAYAQWLSDMLMHALLA